MIRITLWQAFFLALPFLLYWGYVVLVAKRKADSGGIWDEAPITWLLSAGILLMIASLAYWGLTDVQYSSDIGEAVQMKDDAVTIGD